jgi:hypothetical protein
MTAVVLREMPLRELVELMLGLTGKDAARVAELLRRGSLVSGASRFRWSPCECAPDELAPLLAEFPDPEPALPFAPERCLRVTLRAPGKAVEIPREAATAKTLLRRRTFWDELLAVCCAGELTYAGYSYREHADLYSRRLSAAEAERLREAAGLLPFPALRDQVRALAMDSAGLAAART